MVEQVPSYVYLGVTFTGPRFSLKQAADARLDRGFAALGRLERQCAHVQFQEPRTKLWLFESLVTPALLLEELRGVWNTRGDWFYRPIHAVAHLLHPLWRSEEQYENEELEQGLQEYFLTWAVGDVQMLRRLEDDLLLFRNRSHSFGRPTAELRETKWQPVSWWEKYGSCAPTLKRLAVRILSQDCSSGPCERNWSTWALFHTKKRNRLSTAQLERLVYCHCNLRLLDHTRQVNVDKIDIQKMKDIPDIPREELDIYTMLYEEMSAPAHQTRASSRRSRSARGGASTSAAVLSPSSSGSADEGGGSETDAASASASGTGTSSDADAEDADTEEGDQ
ncbi:hypothetical protein L7F22_035051 [Adiantum nelumboides]|nr:hypothetical protein [Adiantum nelumboides]